MSVSYYDLTQVSNELRNTARDLRQNIKDNWEEAWDWHSEHLGELRALTERVAAIEGRLTNLEDAVSLIEEPHP